MGGLRMGCVSEANVGEAQLSLEVRGLGGLRDASRASKNINSVSEASFRTSESGKELAQVAANHLSKFFFCLFSRSSVRV